MPLRVRLSDGLGMHREAFERLALMEDDGALQRLMDHASRTAGRSVLG